MWGSVDTGALPDKSWAFRSLSTNYYMRPFVKDGVQYLEGNYKNAGSGGPTDNNMQTYVRLVLSEDEIQLEAAARSCQWEARSCKYSSASGELDSCACTADCGRCGPLLNKAWFATSPSGLFDDKGKEVSVNAGNAAMQVSVHV